VESVAGTAGAVKTIQHGIAQVEDEGGGVRAAPPDNAVGRQVYGRIELIGACGEMDDSTSRWQSVYGRLYGGMIVEAVVGEGAVGGDVEEGGGINKVYIKSRAVPGGFECIGGLCEKLRGAEEEEE